MLSPTHSPHGRFQFTLQLCGQFLISACQRKSPVSPAVILERKPMRIEVVAAFVFGVHLSLPETIRRGFADWIPCRRAGAISR